MEAKHVYCIATYVISKKKDLGDCLTYKLDFFPLKNILTWENDQVAKSVVDAQLITPAPRG